MVEPTSESINMFDACVTDTTLTVYWDRPEHLGADTEYTVMVDGADAAHVRHTFATITGLLPEHEYRVTVCVRENTSGETRIVGERRFVTECTKRDIDVSLPPYNAVGDGHTMNTAAIQQALDDCDATSRVVIPAGVFLTGALRMHSDSELHVLAGGVLQGSARPQDYEPRIWSRFEGTECECYASLINIGYLDHESAPTTRNVRLSGDGEIRGGGVALMRATIERERKLMADRLETMADYIATCENSDTIPGRVRGRLVNISNAENVELSGLTFSQGPSWNIHAIYSRRIITHGATIRSRGVWNGDGWDPDSSEDCVLFDTLFDTGDDMVAIKSGKNPEGNAINRPTRHVRIFSCTATGGHGIAIGSEMSGGVEDVRVWDTDISRSRYGIHIKGTPKRGGYVRDVRVMDCAVSAITIHAVGYNDDGIAGPDQPYFEDFRFERLRVMGWRWGENGDVCPSVAIMVKGFDKPGHEAHNITIKDCRLGGVEHGSARIELCDCADVRFEGLCAGSSPVTDVDHSFTSAE
ncbi:glycosyl hydrolase family 28 protein [Bifidobacterium oedipodis]|uniref:Polygalacturonase n=1 Tax=Bifidobacterium oedipodis TaxID=2675322 RepID=A0A7Y0EMV1_9BIFI|nr:glycosyl hydrolase family 28 protein [Bifidobacterium sp. DSM 109957]NMM93082.1 polygalacturonase [Bifidobacterium sp. DSM 109957]